MTAPGPRVVLQRLAEALEALEAASAECGAVEDDAFDPVLRRLLLMALAPAEGAVSLALKMARVVVAQEQEDDDAE